MKPNIYEFVVEFSLTNPNTGERKVVCRHEHAYSLMDAMMQANIAVARDAGSAKIDIVSVGPPPDAVVAASDASHELAALVEEVLRRAATQERLR